MTEIEQQIACAEFMGWKRMEGPKGAWFWYPDNGVTFPKGAHPAYELPPLTRDTIQPMLEKMTEEQWKDFTEGFCQDLRTIGYHTIIKQTLTCPLPILVKRFMVSVGIWKGEVK